MDIKKIKEDQIETLSSLAIDWECGTKDPNSEWINLKDHLQVVKELEEKIESMKNCDNCLNESLNMSDRCQLCVRLSRWQPKESN